MWIFSRKLLGGDGIGWEGGEERISTPDGPLWMMKREEGWGGERFYYDNGSTNPGTFSLREAGLFSARQILARGMEM